ncbi:MAG: TatD family nuclease-associated radical SAM protein [Candidatus Eremiobacterota bacterium]
MIEVEKIAYMLYPGKIYLNITNRCSNRCIFCVRNYTDELGGNYLWLTEEPSAEQIIDSIKEELMTEGYPGPDEIIFCGYGEPLYRPDVILDVLDVIKNLYPCSRTRINTNGQSLLINRGRSFIPELKGVLDSISISLNAHNRSAYQSICRSIYGEKAFDSILEFAEEAVRYIDSVTLTVVDNRKINSSKAEYMIDIHKSMAIAHRIGAKFRVR